MPELYSDSNGNRVILRHKGPAGRGIPSGGAVGQILIKSSSDDFLLEWANAPDGVASVLGPEVSVDGHIALFDGTTGKLIKSAGVSLSNYASVSLVSTKQDKETGKGLSQENFTTVLKNKLDSLTGHYRGTFASTGLLEAGVTDPVAGDYAYVEVLGDPQLTGFWDAVNEEWDYKVTELMTGQEIATALFVEEDSLVWDLETCRIYTDAEKTQLAQIQALVDSLGLDALTKSYGTISAFSTSGSPFPATTLTGNTDGTTNLAIVNVSSGALLGLQVQDFDNGGVTTGRLRYTGTQTKKFMVHASICLTSALASGSLMVAIAKNGTALAESRQRMVWVTGTTAATAHMSAVVELSTNQYLELVVGNFAGMEDITVSSMVISATTV